MYYYGQGLKQDRAVAMQWFREALKQEDENAREWVGYKLTTVRIVCLVFQTLFGIALAFALVLQHLGTERESPRSRNLVFRRCRMGLPYRCSYGLVGIYA